MVLTHGRRTVVVKDHKIASTQLVNREGGREGEGMHLFGSRVTQTTRDSSPRLPRAMVKLVKKNDQSCPQPLHVTAEQGDPEAAADRGAGIMCIGDSVVSCEIKRVPLGHNNNLCPQSRTAPAVGLSLRYKRKH